jgi:hypothetical protein
MSNCTVHKIFHGYLYLHAYKLLLVRPDASQIENRKHWHSLIALIEIVSISEMCCS